jgi:hypothetical protein
VGDSGLLLLLLRSLAKNSPLAATGSTGSCWQRTLPTSTCRSVFKILIDLVRIRHHIA